MPLASDLFKKRFLIEGVRIVRNGSPLSNYKEKRLRRVSLILMLGLGVLVGCNEGERGTVKGESGEELTLTAPANTSIIQGGTQKVTVRIERKNFDDPVDVKLEQLPKGVTADKDSKTIAKEDKSVEFTLIADNKADLVTAHEVKVSASRGELSIKKGFRLEVKAK
jgi:hypothetical protein